MGETDEHGKKQMKRRKNPEEPDEERTYPWEKATDGNLVSQEHHIIPKSRGGDRKRENILRGVPSDLHWTYHRLFGNLTPVEIIALLLRVFFTGGRFNKRYRRIVKKGKRPPKVSPDAIVIALVENVFPKDWIPSEGLIAKLQQQRESLQTTPNDATL